MNIDSIIDTFRRWLDTILHWEWLSTAVTVVVILLVTMVLARLAAVTLRRIFNSNKGPLPSASIFINIARVAVWIIGICIILSSCFGVNVGAAITALGIGGIAISLGFQQTLSNLIGGLQVIMSGIVEPGDHIKVGTNEGIVHDVTWRNTTIRTVDGNEVIIPNSVINTEALIKIHDKKSPAEGRRRHKRHSHHVHLGSTAVKHSEPAGQGQSAKQQVPKAAGDAATVTAAEKGDADEK